MKLEIEEGRVYGARYYTAKPILTWDLEADDWGGVDTWPQMVEWCVETYGPTPKDGIWRPGMRWYVNNAKFWFSNQTDLTLFVLRWQ